MKKILLFSFSLLLFQLTLAQAPIIEWQKTIGGSESEALYSLQQTADGGYILGGQSLSGANGDKTEANFGGWDYWVVKLDANGNIVWQNTIGGPDGDSIRLIQQTVDGGYIIGGISKSGISSDKTEANIGGWDYWVVKLDANGNIVWQNTIGGSSDDYIRSIQQTADGGYILGGRSMSGISGDKNEAGPGDWDWWVIKLDGSGTIVWQNTIGGSGYDELFSIRQTNDGKYIIGGYSASGASGDKSEASFGYWDWWVIIIDETGQTIEFEDTIVGNNYDYLTSLELTSDGGYIVGGYSMSGAFFDKTQNSRGVNDYWAVKLKNDGSIAWQNTIGGSGEDKMYSIYQTLDGGYLLGGSSQSAVSGDKTEANRGDYDYWIVKLDQWGNIYWQKTIGGNDSDELWSVKSTADGGYILGGYTTSGISGDKTNESYGGLDIWIIKLNADTPLEVEQSANISKIESFTVLPAYPNPFNPSTNITYGLDEESNVSIAIYDISGKLLTTLLEADQTQGWHSIQWNGTNQFGEKVPAGIYLSKITSGNETKTTKLMLLK